MVKFSKGGLLDNNIYLNNVAKKTGNPLLDGTVDMNIPQINSSSNYNNAVNKNNFVMNAINNPTPNNVMTRANAYNQNMDIEYPPEVLAEPKQKNMLEEYLFGSDGYQPSVEQKKMVYRATKNLTDMEKAFFETNPEKFFDYYHKVGDYKPDTMVSGEDKTRNYSNLANKSMDFQSLGQPLSPLAQEMIKNGADPAEFDKFGTVHNSRPEDRIQNGIQYSFAQWQSLMLENKSGSHTNMMALSDELGSQGNKVIKTPTYNDDGTTTWSEGEVKFYGKPQQAFDKNFGITTYKDWAITGGFQSELANIRNFGEVISILDDPNATSSGLAYEVTPEKLTRLYESGYEPEKDANGKTYQINNTLDLVRAVVFQSLKKTLGGQFTEREAERLVEATFNPALPPEVNLRRILALRDKMIDTFRTQARAVQYYEVNGFSLLGYDSTVGSIDINKLDQESLTTFADETIQSMYSQEDYANMSNEQATDYYENHAGTMERKFMEQIFNVN
tara:strand:- start:3775 stop:5280 length:1506 start_codon:yes stop_codon:yes gene_type:complete